MVEVSEVAEAVDDDCELSVEVDTDEVETDWSEVVDEFSEGCELSVGVTAEELSVGAGVGV